MDCREFMEKIDSYIDDDLGAGEREELLRHARECVKCGEELKAAERLRDIMSEMADEIAPPLPAQAAWRNAVRGEARRQKFGKIYRVAAGVAAALVLVVGCSVYFGRDNGEKNASAVNGQDVVFSYLETDGAEAAPAVGVAMSEESAADTGAASSASLRLFSRDSGSSLEQVRELAEEFGGYVESVDQGTDVAYVTAFVPGDQFDDFAEALEYVGTVEDLHEGGDAAEGLVRVSVMIKAE